MSGSQSRTAFKTALLTRGILYARTLSHLSPRTPISHISHIHIPPSRPLHSSNPRHSQYYPAESTRLGIDIDMAAVESFVDRK